MSFKLSFQIVLLSFILIPFAVFGQFKTTIELTIDTNCLCSDSTNKNLDGQFGIYAYGVAVPRYSNNYVDTLIKELTFKHKQTITLEQGNYKLIYTPSDSLKKTNEYYLSGNKIDLNCFFFNKSHASLLRQMGKKDILIFSSTYLGETNDYTIIPTHTTSIFKKRKKYYITYRKSENRALNFNIVDIKTNKKVSFKSLFSLVKPESLITEEQLQLLLKFEENIWTMSTNNNLGNDLTAKSSITLNNKEIRFYSKGYISLGLWNEITKAKKE